jgi:hypothetical protein
MPDLDRILDFITANARLLDRHRAQLAVGGGDPAAALAVLAGYPTRTAASDGRWSPTRGHRAASRSPRCTPSRCSRRWRR